MFEEVYTIVSAKINQSDDYDQILVMNHVFNIALAIHYPRTPKEHWVLVKMPSLKNNEIDIALSVLDELVKLLQPLVYRYVDYVYDMEKVPNRHSDIMFTQDQNLILFKNDLIKFKKSPFLFIDLDETLIVNRTVAHKDETFSFSISARDFYIKLRPHLYEFLAYAKENFNVVLFTAASDEYARVIADKIGAYFDLVLPREYCIQNFVTFIKDIRILNADLKQSVIVDNSATSYALHPYNGILIKDYTGSDDDVELLRVKDILESLIGTVDFRETIRKKKYYLEKIEYWEA